MNDFIPAWFWFAIVQALADYIRSVSSCVCVFTPCLFISYNGTGRAFQTSVLHNHPLGSKNPEKMGETDAIINRFEAQAAQTGNSKSHQWFWKIGQKSCKETPSKKRAVARKESSWVAAAKHPDDGSSSSSEDNSESSWEWKTTSFSSGVGKSLYTTCVAIYIYIYVYIYI